MTSLWNHVHEVRSKILQCLNNVFFYIKTGSSPSFISKLSRFWLSCVNFFFLSPRDVLNYLTSHSCYISYFVGVRRQHNFAMFIRIRGIGKQFFTIQILNYNKRLSMKVLFMFCYATIDKRMVLKKKWALR
jgi:hypothetical protein